MPRIYTVEEAIKQLQELDEDTELNIFYKDRFLVIDEITIGNEGQSIVFARDYDKELDD